MAKLYVVMGKSSSGKDTIFKRLREKKELGLQAITGYTTRPMRDGEEEGREYHFVSEERLGELRAAGKVIECRTYPTVYGPWSYFTADDGQIEADSDNRYLYIGTLESYAAIRSYFGDKMVAPVYVEVEPGIRLERALARERSQENPKYTEMCRRFLADEEDFKEDNLKKLGIEKRFSNDGKLEECLQEIAEYIYADVGEL